MRGKEKKKRRTELHHLCSEGKKKKPAHVAGAGGTKQKGREGIHV